MREEGVSEDEAHWLRTLLEYDRQLAFLALLTLRGVKPASRWEKPLPTGLRDALSGLGLHWRPVQRSTRIGGEVIETVFAADPRRLEEYATRFDTTPIDKSAETRRFEGAFFGYPPCCVEAFLESAYAPNGLAREEQALLFHWACPDCERTPSLLEEYRMLREFLDGIRTGAAILGRSSGRPRHLRGSGTR
jgi:hypothetical protein